MTTEAVEEHLHRQRVQFFNGEDKQGLVSYNGTSEEDIRLVVITYFRVEYTKTPVGHSN